MERTKSIKKAFRCAPRKSKEQELPNGQSVYFWHQQDAKAQSSKQKWKGPGLIVGNWGNRILIGFHNQILQIASENVRATQDVIEMIGCDSQLKINTPGGSLPLSEIVDTRTLLYLIRYKQNMDKNIAPDVKNTSLKKKEFLQEMEIPENSHFATFILGGEDDFDKFKNKLTKEEEKRVGKEALSHIENLYEHIKKQNISAKKQKTQLEYKIEMALNQEKKDYEKQKILQEAKEKNTEIEREVSITNKTLLKELEELKIKNRIDKIVENRKESKPHGITRERYKELAIESQNKKNIQP